MFKLNVLLSIFAEINPQLHMVGSTQRCGGEGGNAGAG